MSTRVDSAARVQPTEGRYLAHPGICATCGKSPDNMEEIFANPIIELEQYGYIYFCQACCAEIGSFVMMVPAKSYGHMLEKVAGLQDHIDRLDRENAYLKGLLNARIDSAGRGESVSDEPSSVSLLEVEPVADDFDSFVNSLEPDSD